MVKRGLSKSMKKRISAIMNKKKLTVKDKKFLAKVQKGGVWYNPLTWFSSTPTAQGTPVTPEAAAVPSGDDHTQINDRLCKICSKVGADCGCPGGPSPEESVPVPEGGVPMNSEAPNPAMSGEGEPIPQPGEGPGEEGKKMGGRKSRKNKRSKSRKSAKKMAW
jgi:hypothetical protein